MAGLASVFSKPKMPDLPDKTKIPDKEDPAALDARKRRIQQDQTSGGRESTMLSGSPSTFTGSSLGL